MSAKLPFKRRSVASPISHNNSYNNSKQQPQSPSVSAAKKAASPALLRLATAQASSVRQQQQQQSKPESNSNNFATPVGTPANSTRRQSQQQQQEHQHFRSPGVRFSTPAAPRPPSSLSTQSQQQQQQQQLNRSLTSMPKRVPMARKSTDLLRIRDPELRFLALLNSPMIDSRPRGRRSMASASRVGIGGESSRHSICCLPSSPASPSAASPMRPPRLTQPAGEDGTSPQAVWRTLFCDDVEEADEESGQDAHEKVTAAANNIDLKEAIGKYRMLLHHQWELLRFLVDDWKEVAASESVPSHLSPSLEAALAAVSRLTRETLPRFEGGLQAASSAAALHAAWSGVEADILAVRQKFAELEASRLGGWPPLAAAVGVADGVGGENRRASVQRQQVRRSLRVA